MWYNTVIMAKRVYIIHGWRGSPEGAWFPWLTKQLQEKGFEVYTPAMPDPDRPRIEVWTQFIRTLVENPDKDAFFVGHSSGCRAILRYLEELPDGTKVGGAVFVAGWFTLSNLETDEDRQIAKPWLEQFINYEKVKERTKNFVAVFSENDPYVPMENKTMFEENLGAKTVVSGHHGHLDAEDGIVEVPVVLEELLKMAK